MAKQDVFVGIDVSKDRLDVHVRPLGSGFSVGNDAAGHAALIGRLRPLRSKRIVLEATGGYERALWIALSEAGLVAAVVNPRQVREFARASGRLAKTDQLDAAVIAHFAETFAPAGVRNPDRVADRLAEHVLYRRSLSEEIIGLENQLRRLEERPLRARRATAGEPQGRAEGDRPRAARHHRGRSRQEGAVRLPHRLQGRRPGPGLHLDRQHARTRPLDAPPGRGPHRRGPDQSRQWRVARPPRHR